MLLLIILLIVCVALNIALLFGGAMSKADDDRYIIKLREELNLEKNPEVTHR